MPYRRTLSDEQLDEMCRLRERNWSPDRIASHFSAAGTTISAGAIRWQCLRLGADAPPQFRGRSPSVLREYVRGGRTVRPFSDEEDAQIVALSAAGLSTLAIGKRIGRANNSVLGRLMTLARRQARAEDLQHDAR